MKILDLLRMDTTFGHRNTIHYNGAVCWSLDQIERIVHHPALCSDENELLAIVARRIRDERDYKISSSIMAAMEVIASKVQGTL